MVHLPAEEHLVWVFFELVTFIMLDTTGIGSSKDQPTIDPSELPTALSIERGLLENAKRTLSFNIG